jgi:cytochrome P450
MSTIVRDDPPLYPPTVPASPGDLPFLAYLPRLIQNPIRAYPATLYTEDVIPYQMMGNKTFWVTAPALIERILLTDAEHFVKSPWEARVLGPMIGNSVLTAMGPSWRWQRKATAPLFRHADVQAYVPAMLTAAAQQVERWRRESAEAGAANAPFTSHVDLAMKTATFDVIATTILAGLTPHEAETIKRADSAYVSRITWEFGAIVLQLPPWVWHPAKRQMRAAAHDLRSAVQAIVTRRRREMAHGGPASDIVGRLAAARHPDTAEPMPDDMIVNNLATFLEAGHQTTSQALTWTLYLLARAPRWQARVREEIAAVTGKGPIEAAHLDRLDVAMRVFKEAMRLYPPAPTMVRVATQATELGGVSIPRGALVIMPLYAVHRHRTRWEDADRFDPDRFLPEREAKFQRGQYVPFGFGARTCLGMPFALVEGLTLLAAFIRAARFDWDGRHQPEPMSAIVLRPKGGMPLRLTMLN